MNVGQEVTGEANRGPEGLSKRGTHVGGGGGVGAVEILGTGLRRQSRFYSVLNGAINPVYGPQSFNSSPLLSSE